MFLLRRTAARALSATPSQALLAKPRSIATFTTPALRTRQQPLSIAFQRRFLTDEVEKKETEQASAADQEDFAQTAAETPLEDGLTPAEQAPQAEVPDVQPAAGADLLEEAAQTPNSGVASHKERPLSRPTPPSKTVYIGNLYFEVTGDQLKRVFSRFGEIENVKVVYDNRGLSRGFGYVIFHNVEDAQNAVDNLNMQVFEGRNLVVQFHAPKTNSKTRSPDGKIVQNPPSKTLFIGNMSFEMSDKDLNDTFRDIQNVLDVRVAIDRRTGQPRGFAHADFTDVASAQKAREVLQSKILYGRQLRIDYSVSTAGKRAADSARMGHSEE